MTKEEILAMPAGRELDKLVAEKVMGEPYPEPIKDYPWWKSAPVMSPKGQWVATTEGVGSIPDKHAWVPMLYSTQIDAAWTVFLKATNELFSYRAKFFSAMSEQADMACNRMAPGSHVQWPDVITILRHDFPACICRAALVMECC